MNKIILLLIVIIIGSALSTSEVEYTDTNVISQTDFDCTLKAIKVCGSDSSETTNNCLRNYLDRCQKNPSIEDSNNKTDHKKHHSFKTKIVVKESKIGSDVKRICITDTNCNCKTIARNKCATLEGDYDTCVSQTLLACRDRCKASQRCYRLDCQDAGKKRCNEHVQDQCALKHPNSIADRDACVHRRNKCCLRHERANCRRARRIYNYRLECTAESQDKCAGILDADEKCTCVSQIRHDCLVRKIRKHRQTVRRVFDCEEASKIICSEKKCGSEYRECIKREESICEPVCQKESRKQCGNQANGPCYHRAYKTCIHKWKRSFCEKRAQISCGDDQNCLQPELDICKRSLPACMTGQESCDDNNKCTNDICDPVQGCLNVAITCEDNNKCTTKSCDPLVGCIYKTKNCDDKKLCTRDSCNAVTGECQNIFDKKICYSCNGGPCSVDADCDAWSNSLNLKSVCQAAYCNQQTGSCFARKVKECAQKCRQSCIPYHACDNAQCVLNKQSGEYDCVHSDKTCDDHKSCTIDTCDKKLGCIHQIDVDNEECQPTKICDTTEDCKQYDISNNLKSQCQKSVCDLNKGICIVQSSKQLCSTEICQTTCQPRNACETAKCILNADGTSAYCARTPIICDDKKACTVDTCDAVKGCQFTYTVSDICPPNAGCNYDADCNAYAVAKNLADQCLKGVCDPVLGACKSKPIDKVCKKIRHECKLNGCVATNPCEDVRCVLNEQGVSTCVRRQKTCDDGIGCTVDTCDAVKGCVHTYTPDNLNCPPEGKCSIDSDCVQWGFTQKLSRRCQKAVCDLTLGACKAVAKNRICTTPPQCALSCQPANACETASCVLSDSGDYTCRRVSKNCDDGDACTLDTCDGKSGKCVHTPINSATCTPNINQCSADKDCVQWGINKKLTNCQVPSCDTTTGKCVAKQSTSANCIGCVNCVARNVCETASCVQDATGVSSCQYTAKNCDDGKSCTTDRCDVNAGCVNTYVVSAQCTPGGQCATNDNCAQWGISQKLADNCQVPSCDQTLGTCVAQPSTDNTCVPKSKCKNCIARNPCESAVCVKNADGSVGCQRTKNTCDDKLACTADSCDITTGKCSNVYTTSTLCTPGGQCVKNIDCKQWGINNKLDTKCLTPVCDKDLGTCKAISNGQNCAKTTCQVACPPQDKCQTSTCGYDQTTQKLTCQYSRLVCDDKNPCTRDSCDLTKGCVFTFDNTIPGCQNKVCKTAVDCQSLITDTVCQQASCDPTTNTCKVSLINNPQCNPLLKKCKKSCTPNNACETATCSVDAVTKAYSCNRQQITCNDNNPCTVDTCDQVKGCVYTYTNSPTCQQCKIDADCNLYAANNQADLKCKISYCDTTTSSCKFRDDTSGKCKDVTKLCDLLCKAPDSCTKTRCLRTPGTNNVTCKNKAINCDDGKACTVDSCDKKLGCQNVFQTSATCTVPCNKDLDCTAWGTSQNLLNKCQKPVCDTSLGACKAVAGPKTGKCAGPQVCSVSTDCPQSKFGTVCCPNSNTCADNQCSTDLDCVPTDPKTTWGYCKKSSGCGNSQCIFKLKCTDNTQCDDGNSCTKDMCMRDYGFCRNVPRCVDNNCCTLDICIPSADSKSYTCKNPVRSCTNDKTLLDKNYDLLSSSQKTAWLGQCSPTKCCISCVVNAQCDDNNGCTTDSCVNQFCVNKPIDNKWCDPVLSGQAITVEGYFPTFTRL